MGRKKATVVVGAIAIALKSGLLWLWTVAGVKIIGMQFHDFLIFDQFCYDANRSIYNPVWYLKQLEKKIEEEVLHVRRNFLIRLNFMIKYLCLIFAAIILLSSGSG